MDVRSVSVLEVADEAAWAELEARFPLADHVAEVLDPRRRIVRPSFEREVLPRLSGRVLVRYAHRSAEAEAGEREHTAAIVGRLRSDVRRVLHAAQRHALDGVVLGRQAWDPEHDAGAVRALHGAGLMIAESLEDDHPAALRAAPYEGAYRLHPDLAPPPPVPYDFHDAVMEETEDLPAPTPGPVGLLHDMASLAAALEHLTVKVTHAGHVALADARRLGRQLAAADLAASGALEAHPRWGRALRGLNALHVVSTDPLSRTLHLDLGLETTLAGETEEAVDRLLHRLIEADLHVVVPAIRVALRQAGAGAVDELVFLELLRDQHRDVLMPAWSRDGLRTYPQVPGDRARLYDDAGFDEVEGPMVRAALNRLVRVGILRRAAGVFAATADGRRWAGVVHAAHPPIWVTGDLELVVPPDALTVWERFQVERLGRCLQRDVVDRFRLERDQLHTWLATHEVDEAVAVLERRCPALPVSVRETLVGWGRAATRVVLTRGVLLPR